MSGTQRGSRMEDGHAGRSASLPVDDVLLAPSPAAPLPARQVVCSDRRGHVDAEGFALNCKLPAMGRRQDHADGTPIGSATCRCATTFSRLEAEQWCSSWRATLRRDPPFAALLATMGRRVSCFSSADREPTCVTKHKSPISLRLPGANRWPKTARRSIHSKRAQGQKAVDRERTGAKSGDQHGSRAPEH